ncbi:MAG: amidase [Firmicutes bacterium]|nr:amidase [Bacillota bacterium]
MADPAELAWLDATAQAELVRKGEVRPLELVEAAIARIEVLNPKLNAVITPMYDLALEAARGPLPDGPFKGVPYLLKDLGAAYGGVPQAMGSAFMKGVPSPVDSVLTERLKRAGFVIVGKTNTPELGLLPTTEPAAFGPTRNPWDPDRSSGGSSGGSAAAVAAGIVPAAHANDGGGSIRIPASCCGLFGLKPTRGRITQAPYLGDSLNGLTCEHALTRSVRDSAAILDATAGPAPGDPYYAEPPARPFLEEVGADAGRLRVALTVEPPTGAEVHPDCVAAARDAAELLTDLGHFVEEATPELKGDILAQCFMTVWAAGCAWNIDYLAHITGRTPQPDAFEPFTWALYEMGRGVSASSYLLAVTELQQVARRVAAFLEGYDVWLSPTLAEPPVPLGTFDPEPGNPLSSLLRAAAYIPFTPVANLTGNPAMSVPLYWNGEGLPIGVHFMGRYGDEATLFRLASQLEQARPWAGRRPPLCV